MIDQLDFESVNDSKFPLTNFVGQEGIKHDLEAKLKRAKQQQSILPHLLFCGPSEIGKKTLAKCLAYEKQVNVRIAVGPSIERPGDLGALVTNCDEGDLLVIAEIESLNKGLLEPLIQVIGDSQIELEVGVGPAARVIKLPLKPFTLIGTTSKPSQIDKRLRRWMIPCDFAPYTLNELAQIITRLAAEDGSSVENSAAELLAEFSGGSPGNGKVLLKRLRGYVGSDTRDIGIGVAREALISFGYLDRPAGSMDLVSRIRTLNGVEFEEFVANIFRLEGYSVEMTQTTGDHGIDLLMRKGNQIVAVQCKRWDAPVGESVVRDFFGSLMGVGAQFGYLVASSTFTSRAYSFAHNKPMKLIDLDGVLELAAQYPQLTPHG